jgi:hypothetical protein
VRGFYPLLPEVQGGAMATTQKPSAATLAKQVFEEKPA